MAWRSVLALCALSALASAQDVIAADQGDATTANTNTVPTRHQAAILKQDEYEAGYASSGAGDGTMWIMMSTVSLGYMLLTIVMMASCFYGPRRDAPFQRFPDMEQQGAAMYKNTAVSELEPMWRKAFIGKVYTLLALQILVTMVIVAAMMSGGYDFYLWSLTEGAASRSVAFLLTFVLLLSMICYKNRFPLNLILLFGFTACMSYTLGTVCLAYAANGMASLVLEAFAITSLLFIGLTIFTMQSKIDFSFLGLVLPIALFALIIWGFFAMIAFPSFMTSQIYALAGTIIFSLYVLYDTWAICTYLCYDDYVLGAINLYLDFVNLFLMILQLLTCTRND